MEKCSKKKEAKHHNIPRSRGGSDARINLSVLPDNRHSRFHRDWAGNHPPCQLSRLIAINSIGFDGKTIPPDDINTLFRITTMRDWNRLYQFGTIQTIVKPSAVRYAKEIAECYIGHVQEERAAIVESLRIIRSENAYAGPTPFIEGCLNFFKTSEPPRALLDLFQDRYKGHYCWVKAVNSETRRNMLYLIKNMDFVSISRVSRAKVEQVLEKQISFLDKYIEQWQGELGAFDFKTDK